MATSYIPIIAGAEVGLLSAAIIAVFLFIFALAGHGAARLLPSSAQSALAYAAICAGLLVFYPALGAIIGALVALFAPVPRISARAVMGSTPVKAGIIKGKAGKKHSS